MTMRRAIVLSALLIASLTAAPAVAKTNIAPVDACTANDTGNCLATQENLKFYMDVHRRGGQGQDSFLFKTFWEGTVKPGFWQALTNITANIVHQGALQGTLREGQNNVRATGALQKETANTARNYLPSESMCRFGSLGQSLGADDMKMRVAQMAIAGASLQRDLGARGSVAQSGAGEDSKQRLDGTVREFCGANSAFKGMCTDNPQRDYPAVARDSRVNRDINYTRTIDIDQTLNADFVDRGTATPEMQAIVYLSHNLYGSKQLSGRLTPKQQRSRAGQNVKKLTRSVSAARNVAQNSYAAVTAMKTQGSGNSRSYMKALLTQLGIASDKIDSALSQKPSYYAQMDILTKKLYQEPSFYVNLMEGKTNVSRQSGAMEGLELMQDRDIYNSMRRSEMLLALMVQMQSRKSLNSVADQK